MRTIEPIDPNQQQRVILETQDYIERAGVLFATQFESIPVVFDLKGRAAGMYKVVRGRDNSKRRLIRYNPYIFAKYFSENLSSTVPHEVAHYVVDILYRQTQIKPHGPEWRDVMDKFGKKAERTASFDLEGIPVRQSRRYLYHCGCDSHLLGSRRHRKVVQGKASYACRRCGEVLLAVKD